MYPTKKVCIKNDDFGEDNSIEELEKRCSVLDKKQEAAEWARKAIENAKKYHIPLKQKKAKGNK